VDFWGMGEIDGKLKKGVCRVCGKWWKMMERGG